MDACPERIPLTIEQLRDRLSAEERSLTTEGLRRPWWHWVFGMCLAALGAATSLLFKHGAS